MTTHFPSLSHMPQHDKLCCALTAATSKRVIERVTWCVCVPLCFVFQFHFISKHLTQQLLHENVYVCVCLCNLMFMLMTLYYDDDILFSVCYLLFFIYSFLSLLLLLPRSCAIVFLLFRLINRMQVYE